MSWDDPDTSDFFTIKNYVGALCIFAVNEFLPEFPTAMGVKDTIKAEIVVVDGPDAGTRFTEGLLFGSKVVPQLRQKVGGVVLGRIVTGAAKAGQSAPYLIQKPTEEDKELATKFVAANGPVNSSANHKVGYTTTKVSAGVPDDEEDFPY